MAHNSQTWQLQAILDTYTYSRSAFVPGKTHTLHKIHSYNDLWKLAKLHFWIYIFGSLLPLQLKWPTAQVAQVFMTVFTQNGSFPFSFACVILDQENLRNYGKFSLFVGSHFLYVHVCSRFIERWGSSVRIHRSRRGWGSCEHKHSI